MSRDTCPLLEGLARVRSISLPIAMDAALVERARQEDRPVSRVVRRALISYLDGDSSEANNEKEYVVPSKEEFEAWRRKFRHEMALFCHAHPEVSGRARNPITRWLIGCDTVLDERLDERIGMLIMDAGLGRLPTFEDFLQRPEMFQIRDYGKGCAEIWRQAYLNELGE